MEQAIASFHAWFMTAPWQAAAAIAAASDWLWKISYQAAAFAAVVWVISRLARKAPARLRHTLWVLVLVKFLIPPVAHFPSELVPWQNAKYAQPTVTAATDAEDAAEVPTSAEAGASAAASVGSSAAQTSGIPWRSRLETGAAAAWTLGVTAMLGILLIRHRRQQRMVRDSLAVDGYLNEMLSQAAERLGIRLPPRLRTSEGASTPMLVGLLRPIILLPPGIVDSCSRKDLSAMLLHELAHVKRRDMAVMWLQQLVQALFFFHPAVWLVGHELKSERELACDELVLSKSNISPRDYAAAYVAALRLANGRSAVAASVAMAEPFDVAQSRLKMMLRNAVPNLSVGWVVVVALVAAAGLPTFLGVAREADSASLPHSGPYFAKLALNKEGTKVLSILFNESTGTGKQFDRVYADTNFNGKFEPHEKLTAKTRESGDYLIASLGPVSVRVPYDRNSKASMLCKLSFGWSKRVASADSFDVSATMEMRKGSTTWQYRLWGFWEWPSPIINRAQVLKISPVRLSVTASPSGRSKRGTRIRARLDAGDCRVIDITRQGARPKASLVVKDSKGKLVHQDRPDMGKLWGSNMYLVELRPGTYDLEVTVDTGPLGGVVKGTNRFMVK